MGILGDLIRGKFQADQAQHKVVIAEAQAKMKNLDNLSKLTDMLAQYQQQQSWADKGAYQLSPGSEDTNIMNPEIQPVAQPSGQNLLTQFMQTYPETVGGIVAKQNDPEMQIKRGVANMFTGQGAASSPGAEGIDLQSLLADLTGNDPEKATAAASRGSMLEMGGVPIFKAAERVQTGQTRALSQKNYDLKIKQGIKEETVDETGQTKERYVNPLDKTPIIGQNTDEQGWRVSKKAQLQPVDVLANGKKIRIWVSPKGTGGVDLGPEELRTVTEQLPGGEKTTRGIPQSQPFSVTSEQPAGREPIQKTELSSWINPSTGKFPTKTMATDELAAGGFIPYKPLAGEQAARFAKAVNSIPNLSEVDKYLFDSKGNLQKMKWSKMKLGVGEGATIKGKLLQAAWAQIRNESGAAVTDKEVSDLANQYVSNMLSITDPKGIRDGLQRLGADLKGFVDTTDPTGVHQKVMGREPFKLNKTEADVVWERDTSGKLIKRK